MKRSSSTLQISILVALVLAVVCSSSSAKSQPKKSKESAAVTKVIKKVDRQLLSYSPEKARDLLDPVMEDNDPRVNAALGQILILENDYAGAVSKLLAASKKSDDPFVLISLGDSYGYAKNKGKASSSYKQAGEKAEAILSQDPKNDHALFALGVSQQRLKKYDDAVTNLTKAKSADSGNERIYFELGLTQMLRGDNQAGFDQLSRAVELNSGYAYAYYYRALAADKIGKKDITVNDLDRFLRLAPEAPEAAKAQRILKAARG